MATVVRLSVEQVPEVLRKQPARLTKAFKEGMQLGAERARTELVENSPVGDGMFKAGWKTKRKSDGAEVENRTLYAGVIESGARPHGVSKEGVENIKRWVAKKFGVEINSPMCARITHGIVEKLRTKGQEGKWLVRDRLTRFAKEAAEEIGRRIAVEVNNP